MIWVQKFVGCDIGMRDPTVFHEVLTQTLEGLELLGCRWSKLKVTDQTNADACFIKG